MQQQQQPQHHQQHQHQQQQQQIKFGDPAGEAAEAASPISCRPPASANVEEVMMRMETSGGGGGGGGVAADEEAVAGGSAVASGGNRWPRQETLALLKIRSEMDAAFREASLKGPLWKDVSRKLAELGYNRSANKCKEKFENVHKYYKRTKEGRAGRQDGKSYKFFSELEALQYTTSSSQPITTAIPTLPPIPQATTSQVSAPPNVSVPIASHVPAVSPIQFSPPQEIALPNQAPIPVSSAQMAAAVPSPAPPRVSFSSDCSMSTSSGSEDHTDDMDDQMENAGESTNPSSRKRKRGPMQGISGGGSSRSMMEFFEGLVKQLMQKQEAMHQKFLEAIEKREKDRMIREEAWRRQDAARSAREQELLAQERARAASRDAAITAFIQKITGQNIQLPTSTTVTSSTPPSPSPALPPPPTLPAAPPSSSQQVQQPHQQSQVISQQHYTEQHQTPEPPQPPPAALQQLQFQTPELQKKQSSRSSDIIAAIPEQQVPQEMSGGFGEGVSDGTSSRWPKAEILALIQLRSGLESRYQEAAPKGPLWEEISGGMKRIGYTRSAKRCKEKWENINKYYKKVKESNKKRPVDAKTCPYYHELDTLYQKKILGSTSGNGGGSSGSVSGFGVSENVPKQPPQQPQQQQQQQQQQQMVMTNKNVTEMRGTVPSTYSPLLASGSSEMEIKDGRRNLTPIPGNMTANLFGEGSQATGEGGGKQKQPEDIVREQHQHRYQNAMSYNEFGGRGSDHALNQEDDDEDDIDEDDDEENEEDMKMGYQLQQTFQTQNRGSSNGGGNRPSSNFLAMVQ